MAALDNTDQVVGALVGRARRTVALENCCLGPSPTFAGAVHPSGGAGVDRHRGAARALPTGRMP
jgi:hypothetical protein